MTPSANLNVPSAKFIILLQQTLSFYKIFIYKTNDKKCKKFAEKIIFCRKCEAQLRSDLGFCYAYTIFFRQKIFPHAVQKLLGVFLFFRSYVLNLLSK